MSKPPHLVTRQAVECTRCGRLVYVGQRDDLTLCRVCAARRAQRLQYRAWGLLSTKREAVAR